MSRARLRDLGLKVGTLPPGPFNAITDVAGVKVGYSTVIQDRPRIARTGVTAIWPRGREIWTDYVFAGTFSFNGNGEMTGLPWLAEQGLLGAPIGITNTYQVGIVRDAITALAVRDGASQAFHLPVVAETYDGWLSDIQAFTRDAGARLCRVRQRGRRLRDRRRQCRRRHRHDLSRVQGRDRHGIARRRREWRALHGRRAGAGELRRARSVARRWRAGRSRDRTRRGAGTSLGQKRSPATDDGRLHHRRSGDRRAAHSDPMPAAGPPGHHRARLGRRHRRKRQRRYLHRVFDRQSYRPERQDQHRATCSRPTR